jgi:hypothetical protein
MNFVSPCHPLNFDKKNKVCWDFNHFELTIYNKSTTDKPNESLTRPEQERDRDRDRDGGEQTESTLSRRRRQRSIDHSSPAEDLLT